MAMFNSYVKLPEGSDDSTEDRTPRPCSTALRHAAAKSDSGSPPNGIVPFQGKLRCYGKLLKQRARTSMNLHEPPTSALSPSILIFSYPDLPSRVAPHGPCSLVKSMESSTRRRTRGARSRPLCRQSTEYPKMTSIVWWHSSSALANHDKLCNDLMV